MLTSRLPSLYSTQVVRPRQQLVLQPRLQLLDLSATTHLPNSSSSGTLSTRLQPASAPLHIPGPALYPVPALFRPTLYTSSSFYANSQSRGSGILPEPPNWVPAREVGRPFPLATGSGNICGEAKRGK